MNINEYWKKQLLKHTKGDLVDKLLFACDTIKRLEAKLEGAKNTEQQVQADSAEPHSLT